MRNYAGTRKDICSYSLAYNFLIQLSRLQSSVFVVRFSNAFQHGNNAYPKGSFRMKLLHQNEIVPIFRMELFPSFISHIANIGVLKYAFTRLVIKITIFHSFRTRVIRVALVSLLCCTRVARVSLGLHLYCTRLVRVALVSHSNCTRVVRVALVLLVSGTRVAKQTRS